MRIRALAAVAVMEDGSRWAVTALAREGGAQVVARPGYDDPEPVEFFPGFEVTLPSVLDGTWAVALGGVGPVEMRRLPDG